MKLIFFSFILLILDNLSTINPIKKSIVSLTPIFFLTLVRKQLTKLFFCAKSLKEASFLISSSLTKSILFCTKTQGKGEPSLNLAFSSIEFFHFIVLNLIIKKFTHLKIFYLLYH